MIYREQLVDDNLKVIYERAQGKCTDMPKVSFQSFVKGETEVARYSDGSNWVSGVDVDQLRQDHYDLIDEVNTAFTTHKP